MHNPRPATFDPALNLGMQAAPPVLGAGTLSVLRHIATLQLQLSSLVKPEAPTMEDINPMGFASLGPVHELEDQMTEWQTEMTSYWTERSRLIEEIQMLIQQI